MAERDERAVAADRQETPSTESASTYESPTITYLGLVREVVATTQTF